jgi:hypothetical protein
MNTTTELAWFKSSYSGDDSGQCVEIATCPATIHVRDSKKTDGPQLALAPTTWTAFVSYAAQAK